MPFFSALLPVFGSPAKVVGHERLELIDADRIDVLAAAEQRAEPLERGRGLRGLVAALLPAASIFLLLSSNLFPRSCSLPKALFLSNWTLDAAVPARWNPPPSAPELRPRSQAALAPTTRPPTPVITTDRTIAQMTTTTV